jgi:hypothetical protein
MSYTATYSAEDNKLRLYSATRLDSETYARVKAAGSLGRRSKTYVSAPELAMALTPEATCAERRSIQSMSLEGSSGA